MTEKEKMLAGKLYNPADSELVSLRQKAHRLSSEQSIRIQTEHMPIRNMPGQLQQVITAGLQEM